MKELETLTLRIANPRNNRQGGKFVRSEDLKRKFKRGIKQKQKQELNEIFYGKIKKEIQKEKKIKKEGRTPVLAEYINHPLKIKIASSNKPYFGRVSKDGSIIVNKKKFTSPSAAAKFIVKYPVDGWHKWKYERSPGEWVYLDELRK